MRADIGVTQVAAGAGRVTVGGEDGGYNLRGCKPPTWLRSQGLREEGGGVAGITVLDQWHLPPRKPFPAALRPRGQETYRSLEVRPGHMCCRRLSRKEGLVDGLLAVGPKQADQQDGLGNKHISKASVSKVFEFSVACEVVLQPLDVFKHFCPSFQGVLNLLFNF